MLKTHSLAILLVCGIIAVCTTIYLVKISKQVILLENDTRQSCENDLPCNLTSTTLTKSEEELFIDTSSFKFTDNAKSITALIKTNLSSKIFECSELILNESVLGKGAKCLLNGETNRLIIELGSDASILKMGGLSVRKHFSSSIVEIVTVKWGKRKNELTVSLTADRSHILKDKARSSLLHLEAFVSSVVPASSSEVSWKVIKAPSNSAFETLKASLSTITDSSITMRVSNLDIGVYTVQVSVRNSKSESASATTSFEIIDGAAPIVSIQNQKDLKFIIGNLYIISPIISFPKDYKGSAKMDKLKFTYTLESGPAKLDIIQKGDLLVLSNDYTYIPTEGEYVFKLTVQEEGVPDGSVTFKVTATSLAKRIVFEPL
ncbi:predicted protein [Naegleria gruberi]|uniref:Predicted protein n=1 Tax=Naegleria gruberi TaxID=5762 RepID=D2W0U5_NAEGR|nr:uncharacterized protein NAEGRDRAFT_53813 [Naegleria gruberi]EFC37399.1 predicted protein [Naegleria gruberi]|eukprot:XP_002670143.1 predicted protein [Naegleria gruberi strain NEG-M]